MIVPQFGWFGQSLHFLAVVIMTSAFQAVQGPGPEQDYVVAVGDAYVFVMLSIEDDISAYGKFGAEQDESIRSRYSQAGLYPIDQPAEPVWIIDWYAFEVDLSTDGQYLIRWGPRANAGAYGELALAFYQNGELVRSYSVYDIVADPYKLPQEEGHYRWIDRATVDETEEILSLTTLNHERYRFDVATGEIIEGQPPQIIRGPFYWLLGILLLGTAISWIGLNRHRRSNGSS